MLTAEPPTKIIVNIIIKVTRKRLVNKLKKKDINLLCFLILKHFNLKLGALYLSNSRIESISS